jgi:hypothetical protein
MDLDLCFDLVPGMWAAGGYGSIAGHGNSGAVRFGCADGWV